MSVHEILKLIISEQGRDILSSPVLYAILCDYNLWEHTSSSQKEIYKELCEQGDFAIIANLDTKRGNWEFDFHRISHEHVYGRGRQATIVDEVLFEIALALDFVENLDEWDRAMGHVSSKQTHIDTVNNYFKVKLPERKVPISVFGIASLLVLVLFVVLCSQKTMIPDERPLSNNDTEIIVGTYSITDGNGTLTTATIERAEEGDKYSLTVFSSYEPVVCSITFDSDLTESSMMGSGAATVNDKTRTISIILNKDANKCTLIKYF